MFSSYPSNNSNLFHLRKYAQSTLGNGLQLKMAVCLPEGENLNEWLAVNLVDFVQQLSMLYGLVAGEFCTASQCPQMTAGAGYEYLWSDDAGQGGAGHPSGILSAAARSMRKKPIRVSAPEYIELLMNWVQQQLGNEVIFPSKFTSNLFGAGDPATGMNSMLQSSPYQYQIQYPKSFINSTVKPIFKRLFRVYAHLYHSHFAALVSLGEEAHLNTSFRHFMLFCREFNLMNACQSSTSHSLNQQQQPVFDTSNNLTAGNSVLTASATATTTATNQQQQQQQMFVGSSSGATQVKLSSGGGRGIKELEPLREIIDVLVGWDYVIGLSDVFVPAMPVSMNFNGEDAAASSS